MKYILLIALAIPACSSISKETYTESRTLTYPKGGHPHMFSDWATYFYHGPFTKPTDINFKDLKILGQYRVEQRTAQPINLDQGTISLL